MKTNFNSEQLKSYLLGNISNDLAEKLDLEIISNKEIEENLIIAEETLIEEYIEDELNSEEKVLFHKNFLTNGERKSQLQIISQLKQYTKINNTNESDGSSIEEIEPNFFQRLRFVFAEPAFNAVFAIVLLGVISGLVWIVYSSSSNSLSPLEIEFATLNKDVFENDSDYKDYSKLVLTSGKTRSISKPNQLLKDNLTQKVLFNLAIQSDLKGLEPFKVELYKGDEVVFTQPEISIIKDGSSGELRFLIPSKILETGQYQIKVQSNKNADNVINYSFSVK